MSEIPPEETVYEVEIVEHQGEVWKNYRKTDPETSKIAGSDTANHAIIRGRVLWLFKEYGAMTDERLLMRYREHFGHVADSSPRSRRNELVRDGIIRDSGSKAQLVSGKMGTLWELVPEEAK